MPCRFLMVLVSLLGTGFLLTAEPQPIARLGPAAFRIGPHSTGLALSPDGRFLVTHDAQRSDLTHLIDVATGRVVRTMGASHLFGDRFVFAGADRLFVSNSSFENAIQLYDHSRGGNPIQQFTPRSGERVTRFVPSADGRTLVLVEDTNPRYVRVQAVDAGSGRGTQTLPVLHNQVIQAAVSADGRGVATWGRVHPGNQPEAASHNRTVQVWDTASGKLMTSLQTDEPIGRVALTPDGKTLAIASKPTEVQLRDLATGKVLVRFDCRAGDTTSLIFSPDGNLLAGVSATAATQLWDVRKRQSLGRVEAPVAGTFAGLGFPGGAQTIVCVREGCAVHLWEVPSGKRITPADGPAGSILALAFRSDGKELHAVDSTGYALAWSVPDWREQHRLRLTDSAGKAKPILPAPHAILSPDSRQVILGSSDPGFSRFDLTTGKETRNLPGGGYTPYGTGPRALSPDGSLLALRQEGKIRLVDPRTGEVAQTVPNLPGGLVRMAFSGDGKTLALTSSNDPVLGGGILQVHLRLWDVGRGKPGLRVEEVSNTVGATLAFSPDGRVLVMEGRYGNLRLLDADTLSVLLDGSDLDRPTSPYCFSPDGHSLAAGLSGGRVAIWETRSGKRRRAFHTGDNSPPMLAFSPDSRFLASGGHDATVRVWDLHALHPDAPREAVTEADLAELAAQLESADAAQAYTAMQRLVTAPTLTVAWLRKNRTPVPGTEALGERLERLVAQMDSDDFEKREQAVMALLEIGGEALPALYQAQKSRSAEVSARAGELLERIGKALKAPWLRPLREVEVLERIGTPEARKILAALAQGNPHAEVTREAKAALTQRGPGERQP